LGGHHRRAKVPTDPAKKDKDPPYILKTADIIGGGKGQDAADPKRLLKPGKEGDY